MPNRFDGCIYSNCTCLIFRPVSDNDVARYFGEGERWNCANSPADIGTDLSCDVVRSTSFLLIAFRPIRAGCDCLSPKTCSVARDTTKPATGSLSHT